MFLIAAAVFVGSAACRPCHTQIFDSYAKTPMAQSSGRVDTIPSAQFRAAGHRYRIENNRLQFDSGSASFDYFLGSNTAGRSYLTRKEGFLFELPVTWYRNQHRWDASPGYEKEPEVRLSRPVDATCLYCHASRLQPIYGTVSKYADPPFLDNGIGCERCHGPGSDHIQGRTPLVNPAKLAPEERDSVCAQCHLTGEARIERAGRRMAEYRPGARLSDYVTYFVWSPKEPGMKVTSHVEKLAMSACKRAAGDKLWCGTCHEPHSNTNRTQQACLDCHTTAHHPDQSCASCHMPKTKTVDVAHGVFTDHSIRRTPIQKSAPSSAPALTPLLGSSDDRSLGLAYAELNDPRAMAYLERAQPSDAPVLLRLAIQHEDARKYAAVLNEDPADTTALVNLGVLAARQGNFEAAARYWKRALAANPALEGAARNLAQIQPRDEARKTLLRYLEFNPGSQAARAALQALP